MSDQQHHVIIGNGPAGEEAAKHLRLEDRHCRITIITAGRLLAIPRFELYRVFEGVDDWRELLQYPPEHYKEQQINVRRNTVVASIDADRHVLGLKHNEELHYDKLLVASGGGGYLPEYLRDYRNLIHRYSSYEDALELKMLLPEQGHIMMLGGDMMGIDLARRLTPLGYAVTLVCDEHLFWPHQIEEQDRDGYLRALEKMGIQTVEGVKVNRIEAGDPGLAPRRIVYESGEELHGDAILAFCGLMPKLDFLATAGLHIQRGLLVSPELATINERIWAAGDVCQIWSPETNQYRVSYEWKSVMNMGRVAAHNMTGGHEVVDTFHESELSITDQGILDSPFWDYH